MRLGLIPATISPYVLARIGPAHARRWFINGRFFDAAAARDMGLLHEVVAADDLDVAVEREVASMLNAAPTAISLSKGLITHMTAHPAEDPLDFTIGQLADAWETDEAEAGIKAFFAKQIRPGERLRRGRAGRQGGGHLDHQGSHGAALSFAHTFTVGKPGSRAAAQM